MSWTTLVNPTKQKATSLRLSLSMKKGAGRMRLVVPAVLWGTLRLDTFEYVNIKVGTDDNAGKLLVVPTTEKDFKVGHLKHAAVITFPVLPGVTLAENDGPCEHHIREDAGGFIVELPQWAQPGIYSVKDEASGKAVHADKSKPGSLEVDGTVLVMGGARVKLTKSVAIVAQLLVDNFGKTVRKQQIFDELYSLDPEGGAATDKIVDVYIHKLRAAIEQEKLGLAIITHNGVGYEMRRPVAG